MKLSELAAYAEEKYAMIEKNLPADMAGYSVLLEPKTRKWIAVFMRSWDSLTGMTREVCDIKSNPNAIMGENAAWISKPFHMSGKHWIGVTMDVSTDSEMVFQLLDDAYRQEIELGSELGNSIQNMVYRETAIQFDNLGIRKGKDFFSDHTIHTTTSNISQTKKNKCPKRIREMRKISGGYTAAGFVEQAKFMEDYEDDFPWEGMIQGYYLTYHDLRIEQLRGYFTWRTQLRRGEYQSACNGFAYLYIYELLNGIGVSSVKESIEKLIEFERNFRDSSFQNVWGNLRRWIWDFCVIHEMKPQEYTPVIENENCTQDMVLSVLRNPIHRSDEEIFEALCVFGDKKLRTSVLMKKHREAAMHLFANVWRYALKKSREEGNCIFTSCFGKRSLYRWYPLSNAHYVMKRIKKEICFPVNDCRTYLHRNNVWYEHTYYKSDFKLNILKSLLRETDRKLRLYLKAGSVLKEKQENAWAACYVDAVMKEDQCQALEASKMKIEISFADLQRIREDAQVTQDRLLVEEEVEEPLIQESAKGCNDLCDIVGERFLAQSVLTPLQALVLNRLWNQQSVAKILRENAYMPEIFVDEVNEALYETVGDIVLECEGDSIAIVEDYKDEIRQILESLCGSLDWENAYSRSNV